MTASPVAGSISKTAFWAANAVLVGIAAYVFFVVSGAPRPANGSLVSEILGNIHDFGWFLLVYSPALFCLAASAFCAAFRKTPPVALKVWSFALALIWLLLIVAYSSGSTL